ncbi:expressed unknown protein [Seminavis robusta]|uniref:Uncharacterized protein n=1 Tax=Seminavis robusta TaxID=568900 RepID=A0A9N8EEH3_9STRA|nr:expressed unknown protein [Seminavis robusta]|eukprot:Sro819_g207150.1 n/a (933) ;mRNA; f:36737-39995
MKLTVAFFVGLVPAAAVASGVRGPPEEVLENRELQGCNLLAPDVFCQDEGGNGAVARENLPCYNDFRQHCECNTPFYQLSLDGEECEFCNWNTEDQFCRDEGGPGAFADRRLNCWYDFADHCLCGDDYRKTNDECEDCNLRRMNEFCQEFSSVALAHEGRDCYDDFEEDCYCPGSHRQDRDGCEQCNRDQPSAWCRRVGGNRAFHRTDRDCWNDFDDDCQCEFGFRVNNGRCEDCNINNRDEWCRRFHPDAVAIPDRSCYDDFEDDCQCPEGFIADDDTCVVDCHDEDPDEFCREIGGAGAFADETLDCWTDFSQHCQCFANFVMQTNPDRCERNPSSSRGDSSVLKFVFNDGLPASALPLMRCEGDCDDDDDCAGDMECWMRDSFEPVPGCLDGELEPMDYDYCIGATDAPTTSPTGMPTTLAPTLGSPRPTVRPTPMPTPTPDPTSAPPTPRPTEMTMLRPTNAVPQPPLFVVPMPPTGSGVTMYDVRYAGRFQKVQEPGCTFPSPGITVGCAGSMGMVSTSDPSIVCEQPTVNADGSSQVVCNNTCVGEACEDIFLGSTFNGDFGDLRLFGEVYFQCMGPAVLDATGWISVESVGQGSCEAGAQIDSGIGAAFLTAQLGAYGMMVDNYVFDDGLFECNTESLSVNLGGVYSCTFGNACFNDACLFNMEPLNVTADIHRFPSQFIRSNDRSAIPAVPDPMSGVSITGSRTALFQVNSGFYYDETACSGNINGLRMTCLDGTIALVENQSNMACSVQGTNSIQCDEVATAVSPRNEYTRILRYECTAMDQVPQTTVENTGSFIECTSPEDQEVSLELQVGAVCMMGNILYDDFFYECGENSALISRVGEFTCGIGGAVPANAGQVAFAVASVETDFRWGTMGSEMCLTEPSGSTPGIAGLLTSSISSSTLITKNAPIASSKSGSNPDNGMF